MEIKLPLYTINIDSNIIYPLYLPESSDIVMINRDTKKIITHIRMLGTSRYFKFDLEFDKYNYINLYNTKTDGYKKAIFGKIYQIYLRLNLSLMIKEYNLSSKYHRKIAYYLIIAQIKEIEEKKSYFIDEKHISYFVDNRKSNDMYLLPWYYFQFNKDYVFNLKNCKISKFEDVPKIFFRRKGAIIETNNVRKLVNKIMIKKINKDDTLIILPENMTRIWPREYQIITFENMEQKRNNLMDSKIRPRTLILHECCCDKLTLIKKIADIFECSHIWVINCLPLRYYLNNHKMIPSRYVSRHLKINDLSSLSNMWINFDNSKKKVYKYEIIRFILTRLNEYYAILNYKNVFKISKKKLKMNQLECEIYGMINKYYENWKNKLEKNPNNIYSCTTKEKNCIIESKILDCTIRIMTSIISKNDCVHFFTRKIKEYKKRLKKLISNSNYFHKYCDDKKITALHKEIENIDQKIKNYQSYIEKNVYLTLDDNSCSICYSSDNIMTKLICGHNICLICIINCLAISNTCPICKEYITLNKIAVISETIPNYSSDIINYIKNINSPTIILTDMNALKNIEVKLIKIINILESDYIFRISKYKNIKNIVIMVSSQIAEQTSIKNKLSYIIGYFETFNVKPLIGKIIISNKF